MKYRETRKFIENEIDQKQKELSGLKAGKGIDKDISGGLRNCILEIKKQLELF